MSSKNIIVYGYYNQQNLGDDIFKYVYEKILNRHNLIFTTVETNKFPEDTDIILYSGGDLFNEYFYKTFLNILNRSNFKGPIYAISIGIPYPSYVTSDLLKTFD